VHFLSGLLWQISQHAQTHGKPGARIGPCAAGAKPVWRSSVSAGRMVLVAVFGVECAHPWQTPRDSSASICTRVPHALQMQSPCAMRRVPHRAVGKLLGRKPCAEFAVEPHQQVAVELGCNSGRVVVGGNQNASSLTRSTPSSSESPGLSPARTPFQQAAAQPGRSCQCSIQCRAQRCSSALTAQVQSPGCSRQLRSHCDARYSCSMRSRAISSAVARRPQARR